MANKKFCLVMLVMVLAFGMMFTSCFTSGKARDSFRQTAVTIQRVRVSNTILGEIFNAQGNVQDAAIDTPMQIFIDNNPPIELANGAETTILVNEGNHRVFAVLGNVESNSVNFTAGSRSIAINISTKKSLLGKITLEIEVKELK